MPDMAIGWIGFGNMGRRMVRRLLENGIHVVAYNRSPDKIFSHPHLRKASSAEEVAEQSETVFLMVTDGTASRELIFGNGGIGKGVRSGGLVVNMSTIAPQDAQKEALFLKERGVAYLDIPVSGSVVPAEKGDLLLLSGGDPADLDRVRPCLSHLGKKVLHFGAIGSGMKAKLVINLLLASHVESLVQTVLVGESMGLDKAQTLEMIMDSPLSTAFYQIKRNNLERRTYEKAFSVNLMAKDLDLLCETLLKDRIPASLPWQLETHFRELSGLGHGEEDVSVLYEYFRDRILGK